AVARSAVWGRSAARWPRPSRGPPPSFGRLPPGPMPARRTRPSLRSAPGRPFPATFRSLSEEHSDETKRGDPTLLRFVSLRSLNDRHFFRSLSERSESKCRSVTGSAGRGGGAAHDELRVQIDDAVRAGARHGPGQQL